MKGLIWLLLGTSCTLAIKPDCGECPGDLMCTSGGTCPEVCSTDDQCVDGTSCDNGECTPGCTLDEDLDGVCDRNDVCSGGDDTVDTDLDGTPDFCDDCANGDDVGDSDGDGVCDADDLCDGEDDTLDDDEDGIPDGCDFCDGAGADDADGDTVCDSDDTCLGIDDTIDYDEDGEPDCIQSGVRFYPFRSDAGWQGSFEFSNEDATGVSGTGSLRVVVEDGAMDVVGPCYAVEPGAEYLMVVMAKATANDTRPSVGIDLFTETSCTNRVGSGTFSTALRTSWSPIGGRFNALPFEGDAVVRGARPVLRALFATGNQEAGLDNVFLSPAP